MKVPANEKSLEVMLGEATNFASACFGKDSLHRGLAWSSFALAIRDILKEERLHNFEFPSPHNPSKENL